MGAPHAVALRFRDGVEHTLRVDAGQTILEAALAAGAPVLNQCRSGSCCSCSARLAQGSAAMRRDAASSLLPREQEHGLRLLCLTEPASDCAFELAYDSTAATAPTRAKVFIDSIERIAADAMRLQLELADGHWLDFLPGQFIEVAVPGSNARRRYSLSSAPHELPRMELLVRLLPGGAMSEYLRERAGVDDVLDIEGPFGAFFLRPRVRAPHIMIAGGTGLAPMMAMIDTLRRQPGQKPRILLSFGCATPEGLFHREELELRGQWMPTLETRISLDTGAREVGLRAGNPVEAITADDTRDEQSVAYLCGPPALVSAAREHLERLGIRADNIHAEQFLASQ